MVPRALTLQPCFSMGTVCILLFRAFPPFRIPIVFILRFEKKKEILILVAEIEVFHEKLEIENGKTIFFFFFFFCNLAKSYVLLEISLDVRILFSRSN